MRKGRLIVITGPSGVGKTTLLKMLLKEHGDKFRFSVSHTSRKARKGEKEGVDYHFVSKKEFNESIKKGIFLEHAEVHGNLYGTSKEHIEKIISSGRDCILDIDVQGGMTLMSKKIKALYVFIAPPDIGTLKKRLEKRAADPKKAIQQRVQDAGREMEFKDRYDHVIVNDKIEKAYKDLEKAVFVK